VTATVTVAEVEGRRIDFTWTATDGVDDVGNGTHQRFVVDRARSSSGWRRSASRPEPVATGTRRARWRHSWSTREMARMRSCAEARLRLEDSTMSRRFRARPAQPSAGHRGATEGVVDSRADTPLAVGRALPREARLDGGPALMELRESLLSGIGLVSESSSSEARVSARRAKRTDRGLRTSTTSATASPEQSRAAGRSPHQVRVNSGTACSTAAPLAFERPVRVLGSRGRLVRRRPAPGPSRAARTARGAGHGE
jgi:hypothetical protein